MSQCVCMLYALTLPIMLTFYPDTTNVDASRGVCVCGCVLMYWLFPWQHLFQFTIPSAFLPVSTSATVSTSFLLAKTLTFVVTVIIIILLQMMRRASL